MISCQVIGVESLNVFHSLDLAHGPYFRDHGRRCCFRDCNMCAAPKLLRINLTFALSASAIGGVAESIVTSVGGLAVTLAASGGVVTSFAGSEYTVIASATK